MPTVEFLDAGKKIECGQYANLRKVAQLHDIEVYKGIHQAPFPLGNCGGNGLCGTCVMEIVEGLENLSPKNIRERNCFKLHGKPDNYRLSCQTQVMGDVVCITAVALDPKPATAAKS